VTHRPYIRLDATFMDDERVIEAGERAAWLYLAVLLSCRQRRADGVISRGQVARLNVAGWQSRLAKLISVGLLTETDDHDSHDVIYLVPGWGKWQRTEDWYAQEAERKRAWRAEKAARNGQRPSDVRRTSARRPLSDQTRPDQTPLPPALSDVMTGLEAKIREGK